VAELWQDLRHQLVELPALANKHDDPSTLASEQHCSEESADKTSATAQENRTPFGRM
jgi:hypothetical protein